MAALRDACSATETVLTVDTPLGIDDYPKPYTIDSEVVNVVGGGRATRVTVQRGVGGTTAATHTTGASLVAANAYSVSPGSDTRVTVDVPSAQIRTIVASPVSLIAAPGAGKVLWPKRMFVQFTFVSVAYSFAELLPAFVGSTYGVLVESTILTNQTSSFAEAQPLSVFGRQDGVVTYANLGIQLIALTGNPGASGNGSLRLTIDYEVITLA